MMKSFSLTWFLGLEQEAEAEAARAPEPSVPADDEQPACALSGERFDTFWDDAEGQWRFRGAVRLDADQAARRGPNAAHALWQACEGVWCVWVCAVAMFGGAEGQ